MTSTARVRAYRARQASEGKSEVRGIYAKPELHLAIKAQAKKLTEQSVSNGKGGGNDFANCSYEIDLMEFLIEDIYKKVNK